MRGAATCLLLLLVGCTAAEAPPTGILLVTLDTTRADRIGAWGYAEPTTPRIDRLAREGVVFESAVAAAPIPLPSHASILTDLAPPARGVRNNGSFVLGPEVLQRRGWRTGAFVGSYVLDARFGLDQGFEVYSAPDPSARGVHPVRERPADAVVGDAPAWLAELEPGNDLAHFALGVAYFESDLPEKGRGEIRHAIGLEPPTGSDT